MDEIKASNAPGITTPSTGAVVPAGGGKRVPPPSPPPAEEPDEEDGMLRMSFLEHLEELRSRIIKMLMGLIGAFLASMIFSKEIWTVVAAPAVSALTKLGVNPPELVAIEPLEQVTIIWFKLPVVVALFVGSPWILYQIWAFIAPGLYKRERRWAIPFVLCTAGLFILGGLFAYYVAFRLGLTFLLGLGMSVGVRPMVTISSYFDIFVDVILGVALVFELPVVIFFLTLLRVASPRWLVANSRYAILGIVILAAIVTPTPDAFTMMIFAVPMVALYFVGVFAGYLLVLKREGRRFPWGTVLISIAALLAIGAGVVWLMVTKYGYHIVKHWPYLTR
jgi:sec-independent protein translocase protein TatC